MSQRSHSLGPRAAGVLLAALSLLLLLFRVQVGTAESFNLSAARALQGILTELGLGGAGIAEPLSRTAQVVASGRLIDGVTALLVGAALGLSGALLQGLFRNELASPGLVGVTSGAALGASLGIVLVGGLAGGFVDDGARVMQAAAEQAPIVITASAFVGALLVAVLVTVLASRSGRISVPTLLLVGVAINACLGGLLAAMQDILLREQWHLAQALFSWLFGSLSERTPTQVAVVASGLALAVMVIPLVARELDLFGGGEENAESLGVATARTKGLALAGASVAAASAVSVAGQIAFVGLVVPHLVRLFTGTRHGSLLPLSALGGAVFLLGAETLNIAVLGPHALRPGIVLSLIGGPFFLGLLLRRQREVSTW